MPSICFFTATRAEYGLLKPVMRLVAQNADACLRLLVSGAHLDPGFGHTLDEILADGFQADERIALPPIGGSALDVAEATGSGITLYAPALQRLRPDILVLLGDRYETFAAATAAHICGIPVAHIHGGETTEGAIDEAFRHAITKMSHLHFTSCEAYRQRVIQLGEAPDRVFNVGSLGVENAKTTACYSEQESRERLGLDAGMPYIVCTMHPATLDEAPIPEQIRGLLEALDSFAKYAIIFTGANADPGGIEMNALLQDFVAKRPAHRFFMSLGQRLYFSAVRYAACVIGNSSSGIIEAPSFGVPVIDIGDRQTGRIRAASVLHCDQNMDAIAGTLATALRPDYKNSIADRPNPYEHPGTAKRIAEILLSFSARRILFKHFHDMAVL